MWFGHHVSKVLVIIGTVTFLLFLSPTVIHLHNVSGLKGTNDHKTIQFLEYLLQNNVWTQDVQIMHESPTNRYLIALRPFKKEDVVLSMPLNMSISVNQISNKHSNLYKSLIDSGADSHTQLAVFLLLMRNTLEYKPFFDYFPQHTTTPIHWAPDKLERLLSGTDTLHDVLHHKTRIQTLFQGIKQNSQLLPNSTTLQEFTWAYEMVSSRVWNGDLIDKEGDSIMIPLLDLLNHNADPNLSVSFDENAKIFEMTAIRDILVGEELSISYGSKTNGELLMYYGFTVDGNEENEGCWVWVQADVSGCEFFVGSVERDVEECLGGVGLEELGQITRRRRQAHMVADDRFEGSALKVGGEELDILNAARVRRGEMACLRAVESQVERLLQDQRS
ncbi:SET domain-containing protein [Rhizoclosmatium globosum]|uniref:SET domain-containing protein n=1 Tax=Rhizoclosmatium globosum TaxID=329046 RepID=A0A1Y2BVK4_9FUNG|nr:SET domain-containing protein [Rhizoclosmatium globosum]|eukprot:ORY38776.1 SET domain-containing protein [Rhizoclosmatium globosum]